MLQLYFLLLCWAQKWTIARPHDRPRADYRYAHPHAHARAYTPAHARMHAHARYCTLSTRPVNKKIK